MAGDNYDHVVMDDLLVAPSEVTCPGSTNEGLYSSAQVFRHVSSSVDSYLNPDNEASCDLLSFYNEAHCSRTLNQPSGLGTNQDINHDPRTSNQASCLGTPNQGSVPGTLNQGSVPGISNQGSVPGTSNQATSIRLSTESARGTAARGRPRSTRRIRPLSGREQHLKVMVEQATKIASMCDCVNISMNNEEAHHKRMERLAEEHYRNVELHNARIADEIIKTLRLIGESELARKNALNYYMSSNN